MELAPLRGDAKLLLRALEEAPGFIISTRGVDHIVEFTNAEHRRAFRSESWIGKTIREAFPDAEGQDFFERFDRVLATGKREKIVAAPITFRQPDFRSEERYITAVFDAIRADDGSILGVLCEGSDVTTAFTAERELKEERLALRALNELASSTAAETDLSQIVQRVVDVGVQLTGAAFGAFFYNTIDNAGERYTLYMLSGAPRAAFERFPMPRNTAVFGPTFNGEEVVRSDDIKQDPRYGHNEPRKGMPEGHLPVSSYLAVSVFARDRTVLGGAFLWSSCDCAIQ